MKKIEIAVKETFIKLIVNTLNNYKIRISIYKCHQVGR